ncbi:GntR family transcriptional regulator [Fervidibacillus albus]|uniref:GntR family transcriptional regulator n=1 Tax=Fervidibacillus albus TaxID=2980026 RepID=A0A9E8LUL3_9BACI|nr:GntR family transcriptional regulator [Fervidibacillus albus]WAA09099.1 GntR family transcriptional regulator [Fervidibacillus albus]
MPLDFESATPLHVQLRNLLKQEIFKGAYKKKIPSERELMEKYSLSRTTVRLAISQLVHDGVLEKVHGKGTFVKERPIRDWLGSLSSLTETITKMGMKPGAKLLFEGIVKNNDEMKKILNTEQIFIIKRLRYADDIPIAIEKHFFSEDIGKKLQLFDLNKATIYDLLEKELGLSLWKAEQTIMCHPISEEEANYLNLPSSQYALQSKRINFDQNGKPVEILHSVYRPDMYSFHIEMMRTREMDRSF